MARTTNSVSCVQRADANLPPPINWQGADMLGGRSAETTPDG
ncbi:hypothetical protein [Paraburkholderia sp. BL10I2N1]|nr:hypothetical protein [Paraburkholderia sp. BL10I2N1]